MPNPQTLYVRAHTHTHASLTIHFLVWSKIAISRSPQLGAGPGYEPRSRTSHEIGPWGTLGQDMLLLACFFCCVFVVLFASTLMVYAGVYMCISRVRFFFFDARSSVCLINPPPFVVTLRIPFCGGRWNWFHDWSLLRFFVCS